MDLRALINSEFELDIESDTVNLLQQSIDSIKLLSIVTFVEKRTGQKIPMHRFIENPTITFLKGEKSIEKMVVPIANKPKVSKKYTSPTFKEKITYFLIYRGPMIKGWALSYRVGMRLLKLLISIPWYRNFIYHEKVKIVEQFLDLTEYGGNRQAAINQSLIFNSWLSWKKHLFEDPHVFRQHVIEYNREPIEQLLKAGQNVILAMYHTPFKELWWYYDLIKKYPFLVIGNLDNQKLIFLNKQEYLPSYIQTNPLDNKKLVRIDQLYKAKKMLTKGGAIISIAIDAELGEGGQAYQIGKLTKYMRPGIFELAKIGNTVIVPCVFYPTEDGKVAIDFDEKINPNNMSEEILLGYLVNKTKEVWKEKPFILEWTWMSKALKQ